MLIQGSFYARHFFYWEQKKSHGQLSFLGACVTSSGSATPTIGCKMVEAYIVVIEDLGFVFDVILEVSEKLLGNKL